MCPKKNRRSFDGRGSLFGLTKKSTNVFTLSSPSPPPPSPRSSHCFSCSVHFYKLAMARQWRTHCFYLLILFLFGFTVFDVQKLVVQFMGDNKETDMFVVFNETMTLPNITFCISKPHAWSHFKSLMNATEIDEAVAMGLKNMGSKNNFLSTPWDELMVVDAFQTIASWNSMEVETNATIFAMTVQKIGHSERMAEVRKTWKKWADAIAQREVTFEEFRQKVGEETVKRSLKHFQRMDGGIDWKPIQNVKITWVSLRQMCFQPMYSPREFRDIDQKQDQFFHMIIDHGTRDESLDCMSVDFHGRPGEEARFLGPKGRANDGFDSDLCLSLSHELTVEVKEIQTLLPGAKEVEERCLNYGVGEQYNSELECHGRCRVQLIRMICNCTAHTLEGFADSETLKHFPLCDYAKCQLNATKEAMDTWEETLQNCTATCYADCNQLRYRLTKQTEVAQRDESTEVKLIWGSFEYLRLVQKQKWSFSKFVANIGGSMGIWLGLSVFSIIQFVFFILLRLHKMMQKESDKDEETNGKRQKQSSNDSLSDEISMAPIGEGGGFGTHRKRQ